MSMSKSEWEYAYSKLDKAYSESVEHEYDYKGGSNKKIRSTGERRLEIIKGRIRNLFERYPEVYLLVIGSENSHPSNAAIIMDDFFQLRYLTGNLHKLINTVKAKIDSFDTERST